MLLGILGIGNLIPSRTRKGQRHQKVEFGQCHPLKQRIGPGSGDHDIRRRQKVTPAVIDELQLQIILLLHGDSLTHTANVGDKKAPGKRLQVVSYDTIQILSTQTATGDQQYLLRTIVFDI